MLTVLGILFGCTPSEPYTKSSGAMKPAADSGHHPEFMAEALTPPAVRSMVAIAGFENKSTYASDKLWETSAELLSANVVKMGYFRSVEWARMKQLFDWQELSTLSITKNAQARQKAQKILLCEYFLTGAVTMFDIDQQSQVSALSKSKTITTTIRVDLFLQNAASGEYVSAGSGEWTERQEFKQGRLGTWDPRAADRALEYAIQAGLQDLTKKFSLYQKEEAVRQAAQPAPAPRAAPASCSQQFTGQKMAIVVSEEYIDENGQVYGASNDGFSTAIMDEAFENAGFEVVDAEQTKKVLETQQKQLLLAGDIVAAARLGEELNARWMLIGRVSAKAKTIGAVKTGLKNIFIKGAFKLVDTQTGKVVSRATITHVVTGSDPGTETIQALKEKAPSIIKKICR